MAAVTLKALPAINCAQYPQWNIRSVSPIVSTTSVAILGSVWAAFVENLIGTPIAIITSIAVIALRIAVVHVNRNSAVRKLKNTIQLNAADYLKLTTLHGRIDGLIKGAFAENQVIDKPTFNSRITHAIELISDDLADIAKTFNRERKSSLGINDLEALWKDISGDLPTLASEAQTVENDRRYVVRLLTSVDREVMRVANSIVEQQIRCQEALEQV